MSVSSVTPSSAVSGIFPVVIYVQGNEQQTLSLNHTPYTVGRKVDRVYQLLYGRSPTSAEIELARAFLAGGPGAWERYTQALLMSNEFVMVD